MTDRVRETTDGLGSLAPLKYDTGGSDRLLAPWNPFAGIHCYPSYTYDAQADRLATPPQEPDDPSVGIRCDSAYTDDAPEDRLGTPPTPAQEPEADAPVVRPVRTN